MAIDYQREDVQNGLFATQRINAELERIRVLLREAVSRVGTNPNYMEADLDMNLYDILNVNMIDVKEIIMNGERIPTLDELLALRDQLEQMLIDMDDVIAAATSATNSATQASQDAATAAQAAIDAVEAAQLIIDELQVLLQELIYIVRNVQTIDDLRAVNGMQTGQAVEVVTTGRAGLFVWNPGDLSAEVAADPSMDWYVPPAGQNGSQGAWLRSPSSSLSVEHKGKNLSAVIDQLDINTSNEQSFVDRALSIVSMRDHYIVRRADGRISVGHSQSEDVGADFNFSMDNDGMLLIRGGLTAPVVASGVQVNAQNLQGNFSLSSTNAIDNWARDIGDSFELSFTGTELWFNHRVDNRGGVWKFTVDGTHEKIISTWRDIPKENWKPIQSLVVSGISAGAHSVVAEYLGQDPDGTYTEAARGWLTMPVYPQYSTAIASVEGAPRVVVESGVRPAPMSQSSVPEFAIHCRPAGQSWPRVWVPNHGSVNTGVCRDIQRSIVVDGIDMGGDPTSIDVVSKLISSVVIRQSYTAFSTSDAAGSLPMWRGHIVHKYEAGVMTVTHSIETLRDVDTDRGYMSMFPTDYRYTKQARSIGGWVKQIEAVDQITDIPYTRTFAFIDPDTGNGAAYDCSAIGGPVTLDNQWCFLEERVTSNIAKLYPVAFDNEIIPAGDRYTCSARYALISGNQTVDVL